MNNIKRTAIYTFHKGIGYDNEDVYIITQYKDGTIEIDWTYPLFDYNHLEISKHIIERFFRRIGSGYEKCPKCHKYTLEDAIDSLTGKKEGKVCMDCGLYFIDKNPQKPFIDVDEYYQEDDEEINFEQKEKNNEKFYDGREPEDKFRGDITKRVEAFEQKFQTFKNIIIKNIEEHGNIHRTQIHNRIEALEQNQENLRIKKAKPTYYMIGLKEGKKVARKEIIDKLYNIDQFNTKWKYEFKLYLILLRIVRLIKELEEGK